VPALRADPRASVSATYPSFRQHVREDVTETTVLDKQNVNSKGFSFSLHTFPQTISLHVRNSCIVQDKDMVDQSLIETGSDSWQPSNQSFDVGHIIATTKCDSEHWTANRCRKRERGALVEPRLKAGSPQNARLFAPKNDGMGTPRQRHLVMSDQKMQLLCFATLPQI
jgi:hypothetical protein